MRPAVAAEIARRQARLEAKSEITTDALLQQLARVAYFDARKTVDGKGRPLPLDKIPADIAAHLQPEVTHTPKGPRMSYRWPSAAEKLRALELLCKIRGLFVTRIETRDLTLASLNWEALMQLDSIEHAEIPAPAPAVAALPTPALEQSLEPTPERPPTGVLRLVR